MQLSSSDESDKVSHKFGPTSKKKKSVVEDDIDSDDTASIASRSTVQSRPEAKSLTPKQSKMSLAANVANVRVEISPVSVGLHKGKEEKLTSPTASSRKQNSGPAEVMNKITPTERRVDSSATSASELGSESEGEACVRKVVFYLYQ